MKGLDVRMRPRIGFAPVQDITRRANVCVHAANWARSCGTPLITGFAAPASLWIIYFPRGSFTDVIARRATSDSARSYGCVLLSDLWNRKFGGFKGNHHLFVRPARFLNKGFGSCSALRTQHVNSEHDWSNARKAGPTRRKPEACWMPRNFSCKMKSSSN